MTKLIFSDANIYDDDDGIGVGNEHGNVILLIEKNTKISSQHLDKTNGKYFAGKERKLKGPGCGFINYVYRSPK